MIEALAAVTVRVADLERAARACEVFFQCAPEVAGPARARFRLTNVALDLVRAPGAEGLSGLVFATDDLAAARRTFERRGLPVAGDPPTIDPGASHGVGIALARTKVPSRPAAAFEGGGIEGLDHVVIRTPNVDRALALYGARLGLDLRLDRSNPAFGTRLLFFRCGDTVVEIGADLAGPPGDGPDILSGLAWRTPDADAVHARMAAGGLDVSPVRPGRKPGTRVFTVRSGVPGAPSLVIGPTS
ncbi:MAG: VOC family protein [Caulobacteraceae bacterium]